MSIKRVISVSVEALHDQVLDNIKRFHITSPSQSVDQGGDFVEDSAAATDKEVKKVAGEELETGKPDADSSSSYTNSNSSSDNSINNKSESSFAGSIKSLEKIELELDLDLDLSSNAPQRNLFLGNLNTANNKYSPKTSNLIPKKKMMDLDENAPTHGNPESNASNVWMVGGDNVTPDKGEVRVGGNTSGGGFALAPLQIHLPSNNRGNEPIRHVMSSASDNFREKYIIGPEIGKGGFSTVYQCNDINTGDVFAVKKVDLRPLRLRERFDPTRLRREVDIMRRLKHSNIIQFVEVFESPDELLMVMEYCPGRELFDVILDDSSKSTRYLSEDEARIYFAQVANALYYLHSLNILHRDIKPENILISDNPHPITGLRVAKILDFGLSKNAGNGSEAKTFVGTPCYLAPEVEFTSRGLGGVYGLPADCWSLGAVLYVMLVARFPEFEHDPHTDKVVLKMQPQLWDGISSSAKDLIRGLMNTNPKARLTMDMVLQHPWMGQFRLTKQQVSKIFVATSDLGHKIQEEEVGLTHNSSGEMTALGTRVQHHAMVVRDPYYANSSRGGRGGMGNDMDSSDIVNSHIHYIGPLMRFQKQVQDSINEAHNQFISMPLISAEVHKGAVLCKNQLLLSTKMLTNMERTSRQVLDILSDLELAISEGVVEMATNLFTLIKTWVADLRLAVSDTQKGNADFVLHIQTIVEKSAVQMEQYRRERAHAVAFVQNLRLNHLAPVLQIDNRLVSAGDSAAASTALSTTDLMMNLFGTAGGSSMMHNAMLDIDEGPQIYPISSKENSPIREFSGSSSGGSNSVNLGGGVYLDDGDRMLSFDEGGNNSLTPLSGSRSNDGSNRSSSLASSGQVLKEERSNSLESNGSNGSIDGSISDSPGYSSLYNSLAISARATSAANDSSQAFPLSASSLNQVAAPSSPNSAASKLVGALSNLRQVDDILDQLSYVWANTELVLDQLTKKGQHVEQFVGYAKNPRLLARFKERIDEYKRFWESIEMMCNKYLQGVEISDTFESSVDRHGSPSSP